MAVANKETFDIIIKRRNELVKKIRNISNHDTDDDVLSLKIRWNELGVILEELGYEEDEPDLDELLKNL